MASRKFFADSGSRFCRARTLAAAVLGALLAAPSAKASPAPFLMPLRREVIPVHHGGKLVSFKTSYSGLIHVGSSKTELRVVFDTGSGHVVLPSKQCRAKACSTKVQYDPEESGVNVDTSNEPTHGSRGDGVTIGFGRGEVRGTLVRDKVCLGPAPQFGSETSGEAGLCMEGGLVAAYNMSSDPFENFTFDGIVGLGRESLAVTSHFSFLNGLVNQEGGRFSSGQFAVFLAEGDDEEQSEIAFGGYNPAHLMEPLTWVPLNQIPLGYWTVEIVGLYVDDLRLDACAGEPCTGILDTGTSHLGVPPGYMDVLEKALIRPAGQLSDCRRSEAPVVRVELQGFNITILPENYMRRLPIDEGILQDMEDTPNETSVELAGDARMLCTAKLMQVKLPQLGPNTFLLGEPALHRYYTAYDAKALRVGLGLAARRKRPQDLEMEVNHDEIFLMQQMQGTHQGIRQKDGVAGS